MLVVTFLLHWIVQIKERHRFTLNFGRFWNRKNYFHCALLRNFQNRYWSFRFILYYSLCEVNRKKLHCLPRVRLCQIKFPWYTLFTYNATSTCSEQPFELNITNNTMHSHFVCLSHMNNWDLRISGIKWVYDYVSSMFSVYKACSFICMYTMLFSL